jgi:cyclopropane fatty-acyl-phospholipid synthase-like methyltransferase
MVMFNLAMNVAPQLVKEMDLSDRHHLLDLGGGPGTYAIHFCLDNPQLKAVVFDLPATKPFAEETIKKFHLSRRIKYLGGDYLKNQIKGTYDVVFLSHILHSAGLKDCQKIIRKAVSVLEPGGMIIVHEFILDDTMDGPLFPAIFSLNMLLGTKAGQAYSEKQIMDMLTKTGVKESHRLSFKGTNNSGVITGFVE